MKFTEEFMMCTEKHVLIKKCLQLGWIWFGHYEPDSKRQSMEEKQRLSGKEKFQAQQSVKKVILTVFCDMKESMIIDFFEKGATVNNVFLLLTP